MDAGAVDSADIDSVRRFNRTVTQRVGALDDHYLSQDRPLGEARLLWEIGAEGPGGADVRSLRARLGLDSGYLSRLLRSLEATGLVVVAPAPGDRRVRQARLTAAGVAERSELDRRSDDLAGSILARLGVRRRDQLVEAMTTVTRLLTSAAVEFATADPMSSVAQECLRRYYAELGRRFDDGFDPAATVTPDAGEFASPRGVFVVATLGGEPIGCGGLLFTDDDTAYLKRMWVADSARGLGVGRGLLEHLERLAAHHDRSVVQLETNRVLAEAITLYRSAGYVEVEPFNDEPYAHHWFAKHLVPPTSS